MSRVVTGYDRDGHTVYRDLGPARAAIQGRGGLTLGQALTAVDVKPVGAEAVRKVYGLRGESLLADRRKR